MNNLLEKIPVNWDIVRNPVNWLVIGLMVAIAALALHTILKSREVENG
jgi:hypothetical protein